MNTSHEPNDNRIKKFLLKNAFLLFGLGALIWFLIRVIPKPSRAGYPCMRVAAPMASSFVLWIIGLAASIFAFQKMNLSFAKSKYFSAVLFLVIGIAAAIGTLNNGSIISFANANAGFEETVTPNMPIGEAKGINPGRVVWAWNPDATNENCANTYYGSQGTPANDNDDGWFLNKNNDQVVIDNMLSSGLMELTGESNDLAAWNAIFNHFNEKKHGSAAGYNVGENIFIKINATSTWGKGFSWGNISADLDHMRNEWYGMAETSPHLILSLLRQLINIYGIPQENIFIGDPMKHIYNNSFDLWYTEFPYVHYMANEGGNNREQVVSTESEVINYSDKGNSMGNAISDKIYSVMNEADYLINVPTMKAHARAGITLFAKNHFGSHIRSNAEHLHSGLVAGENAQPTRLDSNMYRVQVDLMGHEKFGGNQLLFLLDALWSGSEAIDPPTKWEMEPFNGDWTSSIFLSQDPVAIESVAFDFLYQEYDGRNKNSRNMDLNFPRMNGTTDYLRQAASSDFWPEGIIYDPENDGTPIASLGVNEHWNNPIDKKYTRNLGTGEGIELIFIINSISSINSPSDLTATLSNETEVELNWADNSDNELGFVIERKEGVESTEFIAIDSVGANQTNYLDGSEKNSTSYVYRISAYNEDGVSEYSTTVSIDIIVGVGEDKNMTKEFKLNQNYPNPFNPSTTINFYIKEKSEIKLEIYDLTGSLVKNLYNGTADEGSYKFKWNSLDNFGKKVASGNYIYTLTAKSGTERIVQSKKMTLLK